MLDEFLYDCVTIIAQGISIIHIYRDSVSDEGVEIMKLTKETLLQGLCDEDLACRLVSC